MKYFTLLTVVTISLAACQSQDNDLDILAPVPELRHGLIQGYMHGEAILNSAAFLPPPPADESAKYRADVAASDDLASLEGSPRWGLATRDAELAFPAAANIFSCAVGVDINETTTPALYRLMQRSLTDFGLASYPAKQAHQRLRPFMINQRAICTPDDRAILETDGSYPSGHSAIGWGWALLLSQLVPEKAEAVLARGREYARSRMVCNVHWMSDTEAGMAVGAAAFARLQNNALFQATMAAARSELASGVATIPDTSDCELERESLAFGNTQ